MGEWRAEKSGRRWRDAVKIYPASVGLQREFTAPAPMQNTKFRAQGKRLMAANVVLLWVNRNQQLNVYRIIFWKI